MKDMVSRVAFRPSSIDADDVPRFASGFERTAEPVGAFGRAKIRLGPERTGSASRYDAEVAERFQFRQVTPSCSVGLEDVTKASLYLRGDSEAVTVDVGDDRKEVGSLFGIGYGCFFILMKGNEEGGKMPGGEGRVG